VGAASTSTVVPSTLTVDSTMVICVIVSHLNPIVPPRWRDFTVRLVFAELETYAGGGANGGNGGNGGGSGGGGGVGGKGKSRRMSRLGGARGSRAVTRKKATGGAGRRRSTVVAMKATVKASGMQGGVLYLDEQGHMEGLLRDAFDLNHHHGNGEGGEDGGGGGDGRQSSTFAASLIDFVNGRQDKKYNKKGLGVPITVEMFADWIGVIDVEETFSQYVG